MGVSFVMSARKFEDNEFISEPGISRYLLVPDGSEISPAQAVEPDAWIKALLKAAVWKTDVATGNDRGDILFFVHGYNNSQAVVLRRHRQLVADLTAVGFKGVVASFDWPSADHALNYLEDRHDAKKTAMQLVKDGIAILAERQTPQCWINVHLLGHSTGAYVIREAFDDADDTNLAQSSWMASQIVLIGADVSVDSMSADNSGSESLYRHCTRLTNYSNLKDSVLKLSNAKRLGTAPRVGRMGLPPEAPAKSVNVDCTEYFQLLEDDPAVRKADQVAEIGSFCHSWHIGNRVFAQDLFDTLRGDVDRTVIPTRQADGAGKLTLKRA